MALSNSFLNNNFYLQLADCSPGSVSEIEIGSIKSESVDLALGADYFTEKTLGNLEYGDCKAKVGLSQGGPIIDWIQAVMRKDVIEKSGAFIVADQNFKERRRADFTGALITEVTFDDFNAGDAKKAYQVGVTFSPEHIGFDGGTVGAPIKADQSKNQKSFNAANFRCDVPGIGDRIKQISGLGLTAKVEKEHFGHFRQSERLQGALTLKDVTFKFSGDDKTFKAANAMAKNVLESGNHINGTEIDTIITYLDPTMKKELGAITLTGMTLKEMKFGKFDNNKNATADVELVFAITEFKYEAK